MADEPAVTTPSPETPTVNEAKAAVSPPPEPAKVDIPVHHPMASFHQQLRSAKKADAPKEVPKETPKEEPKPEAAPEPPKAEPTPAEATPGNEKEKVEPKATRNVEKELKDQSKANLRLGKENAELKRSLADLQAHLTRVEQKLDGTYKEPESPDVGVQVSNAGMTGRIQASHAAAVEKYGEQYVMETVWSKDLPTSYMNTLDHDPLIRSRVVNSDAPVLEAIKVMKEFEDKKKYGATPEEIKANLEKELRKTITKEVMDGFKTKPGPEVKGLERTRGTDRDTNKPGAPPSQLDFRRLFPHGSSRL